MKSNFWDAFLRALEIKKLTIDEESSKKIKIHFEMMMRWNKVHNITAVKDPQEAVWTHYIDSLLGLQFLKQPKDLLDYGSGAGFPGLMAALVWPSANCFLAEVVSKKTSFLKLAVQEMELNNVVVWEKKAEEATPVSLMVTRAAIPYGKWNLNQLPVKKEGFLAIWATGPKESDISPLLKNTEFSLCDIFEYTLQSSAKRGIIYLQRNRST